MFNTVKIDEVYDVDITSLENEGKGVCKVGGMICFVPKVLPGEKVKIRITEIKKNYARGKLIDVLKPSDKRIDPNCPFYKDCGGCHLRHQSKEDNLLFKKEKVETALKRIGKVDIEVDDVIPCIKNDNYRNKMSFKVENNKIGFYEEGTYRLVSIDKCNLAENRINEILGVVKEYLNENENEIKMINVRESNITNELLIDIYSVNENDIDIASYLALNESVSTVIFNDKVVYGNGYINEITNGLMFKVSSNSFYQVNSIQVEKLYEQAIKMAELQKDEVALDLYCGTGTIACIISGYVKKVLGIELVDDAIIDAKENLITNNINNVRFICGDAAKEISKINEKVDVIFVDPPRKGIDRKAIAVMKKLAPKKIIYISCNPVTMSRDISYLTDLYDVKKVTPVDMFPNTEHVECICFLERR